MSDDTAGLIGDTDVCGHDPMSEVFGRIENRAAEAETDPDGLSVEVGLLARSGLLKKCFSRRRGGVGLASDPESILQSFDLLRRMGRANLSVGRLFEGHLNAVKLIELYGAQTLQERALHVVEDGGLLGVWGADGRHPVTYNRVAQGFMLDGQKVFASGLGVVRLAIVTMRKPGAPDSPPLLALVDVTDRERQDAASWTASGMRATRSGRYDFTDVTIDEAQCVGHVGDYEREPHFEGGIWRYSAVHLGGVESLLAAWRTALNARGRFGDPFQLARFARGVALSRAAASLLRDTALRIAATPHDDAVAAEEAVTSALLARQFTEESCVKITALAEKSLGTFAHMPGNAERIRRDLSLFLRQAALDEKLLRAAAYLAPRRESCAW